MMLQFARMVVVTLLSTYVASGSASLALQLARLVSLLPLRIAQLAERRRYALSQASAKLHIDVTPNCSVNEDRLNGNLTQLKSGVANAN
jgi:hypothetical protein